MNNKKVWVCLMVLFLVGLLGFQLQKKQEQSSLPPKAQAIAGVTVAVEGVGALGKIEPRSRVITVMDDSGPDGAYIQDLQVTEGQVVEKGQVLAILSDLGRRQLRFLGNAARVRSLDQKIEAEAANVAYQSREFERMRQLLASGAIAKSLYDVAMRNDRQARSTLQALQEERESVLADSALSQEETRQGIILSPISGTVLSIHARPGERLSSSKGLANIADLSTLDVVAEVYERDIPRVRTGQKARIQVPGIAEPFDGAVYQIGFLVRKNDLNNTDPLSDKDTRTVPVRIALEGSNLELLRHLIYMQVAVRIQ